MDRVVVSGRVCVEDVKVYKSDTIKIGEEIPTVLKVLDPKGNIIEIPLCLNCLKYPSPSGSYCRICVE